MREKGSGLCSFPTIMGTLHSLCIEDAFEQQQLFPALLAVRCSVNDLAALALTSPLARAWCQVRLSQAPVASLLQLAERGNDIASLSVGRRRSNTWFDITGKSTPLPALFWSPAQSFKRLPVGGGAAIYKIFLYNSHTLNARCVAGDPWRTTFYVSEGIVGAFFPMFDDAVKAAIKEEKKPSRLLPDAALQLSAAKKRARNEEETDVDGQSTTKKPRLC